MGAKLTSMIWIFYKFHIEYVPGLVQVTAWPKTATAVEKIIGKIYQANAFGR